jgi:hypothetical protein
VSLLDSSLLLENSQTETRTHAINDRLDHPAIDLLSISMALDLLQEGRDESVIVVLDHPQEEMFFPLDER